VADELAEKVYGARKEAVLSAAEAGNLAPLAACPFLINSRKDIAGALARKFLDSVSGGEIFAEAGNLETLMQLGLRGCGAFFCPENLARAAYSEKECGRLRFLSVPGGDYEISFGYRKADAGWSLLTRFIEMAGQ